MKKKKVKSLSKIKSDTWDLLSKKIRLEDPICEVCNRQYSQVAHHVVKKSASNAVYFLEDNIWAICKSCHYKIHYVWDCFENKDIIDRIMGENEYYKIKVISKGTHKYSKYELQDMMIDYRQQIKKLKSEQIT
jgi:hypothetical protein